LRAQQGATPWKSGGKSKDFRAARKLLNSAAARNLQSYRNGFSNTAAGHNQADGRAIFQSNWRGKALARKAKLNRMKAEKQCRTTRLPSSNRNSCSPTY